MDVLLLTVALSAAIQGDNKITEPNQALWELVHELREEVAELKSKETDSWLSKQRKIEIESLVQGVLADADTRYSLQGSAASSGWPWVGSEDGNFKLKFGGQIQARWVNNESDTEATNNASGFEQRRTKLKFSGHVGDPSWQYKVTSTWSRGGGSDTEDAYINKKWDDGSWFKFGQYKAGFLRENIVSSSKQLGVERSMLNNAFAYGWTQGLEYGWRDDSLGVIFQYNDGPGAANSAALDGTPNTAWIARMEYRTGDASWKDFGYLTSKTGAKSGMLVGFSYQSLDHEDGESQEYGNISANESTGWSADVSWRGDGWNILAYLVDTDGTTNDGTELNSSGWLLQGGYMINDNTELFAKTQHGEIEGGNDMDAVSVGFNHWPIAGSSNVKWTTDISWADPVSDGTNAGDWVSSGNGWRADSSDQTLIRTQLQLLF